MEGLTQPTMVAWAPDGRMFIAEKQGALKVVAQGATTATLVRDYSARVNHNHDRGLLGLAVASQFDQNGYLYLLYTYDVNQIGTRDSGSPMVSQLLRVRVTPSNAVSEETVILGTYVDGPCPTARKRPGLHPLGRTLPLDRHGALGARRHVVGGQRRRGRLRQSRHARPAHLQPKQHGGQALSHRPTYDWDFGDGSAHGSGPAVSHTFGFDTYTVRLTVSDDHGNSDVATATVNAGNTPPEITIEGDSTYRGGEPFNLSGSATDAQDGNLPAANLEWDVRLIHAEHTHVGGAGNYPGVAEIEIPAATDHDADSHYEVSLSATDSNGATATKIKGSIPRRRRCICAARHPARHCPTVEDS